VKILWQLLSSTTQTTLHLGDGKLFTFWIDPWLDGTTLVSVYLELAATVPARLRREHTVASALNNNAWIKDVRGALTIPVLAQFIELHHRLSVVVLHHGMQDIITWRWCSSGRFSTASAYRALFTGQIAVLGAKEFMGGVGPRTGYSDMVFRITGTVSSAARALKSLIT
jgi:hypothetical protein